MSSHTRRPATPVVQPHPSSSHTRSPATPVVQPFLSSSHTVARRTGRFAADCCTTNGYATGRCAISSYATGRCAAGRCTTNSCATGCCAISSYATERCATSSYATGHCAKSIVGRFPKSSKYRIVELSSSAGISAPCLCTLSLHPYLIGEIMCVTNEELHWLITSGGLKRPSRNHDQGLAYGKD